ncbi:hypothetical protein [Streptomyces sp. NPDC047042]|uniref:hypothetical protein n=1 Tax=Streptomyces sp. NPDC047042 TaxID=3154807 RepID=UPI0033D7692F
MKMEAAVIWGPGTDWSVEEMELDGPRANEVLVRYTTSGLCYFDDPFRAGDMAGRMPAVGGHEGADVEEVVRGSPASHPVTTWSQPS